MSAVVTTRKKLLLLLRGPKKEINYVQHKRPGIKTEATYRILISGGGTGGHIYPALAIANAWMEKHPDSEILFVGAEGKMEMQKVLSDADAAANTVVIDVRLLVSGPLSFVLLCTSPH